MIQIHIKTQFEGFHFYKNAPLEVEFLRSPHRHLFAIDCWIEVYEEDRELEFFIVKKKIDSFIEKNYKGRQFEYSCEQIAKSIVGFLEDNLGLKDRYIAVEVLEDNENGGLVTNQ